MNLRQPQKAKFRTLVGRWARKNFRNFPWREDIKDPYKVFVAEMLLKRTTAKAASPVYAKIIKQFPNIRKLSSARKKELEELVSPIGYRKRASEMVTASKFILKNYGGKIPKTKEELLKIPFVGNYTSNAILSLSFDKPEPMLDSNVNRIISRSFFSKDPTHNISREVEDVARSLVPHNAHREFNFAMLDIGGTICLPRKPKCELCPLNGICKYYECSI
jgi:A/G-specific adenine glycosylase